MGSSTAARQIIYNAVLKAHDAVISHMQPGVRWIDMHKLAEQTILESLEKENIIHGDIGDMMVQRLGVVFMPHGLGHLLGIDTHDPGGYPEGLERPKEPGLSSLRTTRELKEGMGLPKGNLPQLLLAHYVAAHASHPGEIPMHERYIGYFVIGGGELA